MGLHDVLDLGGEPQGQGVGEAAVGLGGRKAVQGLPHPVPVGVEEGVVGARGNPHLGGKPPPKRPQAVPRLLQKPGVLGEGGKLLEAALVEEAHVPLPEGGVPQNRVADLRPRLLPHEAPKLLQGLL